MSRGKFETLRLDDRSWSDIVNEAQALKKRYAQEWDDSPSDLGNTLIELFAWLVEGMIYRLNRVPEKNYIEFLNLLGITRHPATPASTFLTFSAISGQKKNLSKGTQAATQQTESQNAVVFETDDNLTVLPINLLYAIVVDLSNNEYHTQSYNPQSLSVAPFVISIPAKESARIDFGFDGSINEEISLLFGFSTQTAQGNSHIALTCSFSPRDEKELVWPVIDGLKDGTEFFKDNGCIKLTVPSSADKPWSRQSPKSSAHWSSMKPAKPEFAVPDECFWISIDVKNTGDSPVNIGIDYMIFNSVSATNALTISAHEPQRTSNGRPFQSFELERRPLYKGTDLKNPYGHIEVNIQEPTERDNRKWKLRMDDFPEADDKSYQLNPVTGTISFGNFDSLTGKDGHGLIPPEGTSIIVQSYRYVGGGSEGNLPPGTINVMRTIVEGIRSVTNLIPGRGGSDEETVEDAKLRAPQAIRIRNRAVTVEDYEYLAKEVSTHIKKVRCLPAKRFGPKDLNPAGDQAQIGDPWTYGGLIRESGHVNLIIIPDESPGLSLFPGRPKPTVQLVREVLEHVGSRCPVGTILHVESPRYLPIIVAVKFNLWKRNLGNVPDENAYKEAFRNGIRQRIASFLHPVTGGLLQEGWEVAQDFLISGLLAHIQPDAAEGFVSEVSVGAGTPDYEPPQRPWSVQNGQSSVWIHLADYEIVCNGEGHSIDVYFI
jgi:hypothetical protein